MRARAAARRREALEISNRPVEENQKEMNGIRSSRTDSINEKLWEKPDPNDPRLAKARAIQAQAIAHDKDPKAQEALVRHEAEKVVQTETVTVTETIETKVEPPIIVPVVKEIPFKVPFRLTSGGGGLMVSELSDCVCGAKKLDWHPVCLKVKVVA